MGSKDLEVWGFVDGSAFIGSKTLFIKFIERSKRIPEPYF